MQPKVKITLSVLTFVAMVLTGLAAAEQVPTTQPKGGQSLISPSILSLSPKLMRKKNQFEKDDKTIREMDSLVINQKPAK
ncbi:MAG: hypothetical protein Q7T20_09620 [Saprospiraceae bacterium]|nr:hypothetical protein [Saprospiraceae bacterium]